MNEELTAEEWKRLYEKEKEKAKRWQSKCEKMEAELARWRQGETVSAEEQVNVQEPLEAATPVAPPPELKKGDVLLAPVPATPSGLMIGSLSNEERQKLEEERERLYQQLDEKDEEINEISQYVEKLKEQLLEQEEVSSFTKGKTMGIKFLL